MTPRLIRVVDKITKKMNECQLRWARLLKHKQRTMSMKESSYDV